MIRSLLRIGRKTFCTKSAVDTASKVGAMQTQKPKWMKFFEGQDPIKIDLERSIKSDNLDLIQNYIKTNYLQFEDFQLVQVIPKVSRTQIIDNIKKEIRLRIISNNFNLTTPQYYTLLEYLEEINFNDRFLVQHTLSKVSEQFSEYSHFQQYKIIQLGFVKNNVSIPIVLRFLDYFNENKELFSNPEKVIEEYSDKLSTIQFTQYMTVINKLKDILVPEEFKSRVNEDTLQFLTKAVKQLLIEKQIDILSTDSQNNSQIKKQILQNKNLDYLNDTNSYHSLEKIFSPDVLKILPYDLKIEYKKLLVKTQKINQNEPQFNSKKLYFYIKSIEDRFDQETHLGKYGYYKSDRGGTAQKALMILRNLISANERELVEKVLILIGNQILLKEQSDFKFDFRLFQFMTKYQYAYKYYIDESFISMKSLLRSLMFNTKKFSEEGDLNIYHVIFLKYKSYNELNYASIIKQSEHRQNFILLINQDVYTRKVDFSDTMVNQWNQLQKDVQVFLQEYLSQSIASGQLTRLLFKIPSPVFKEEDDLLEENEVDFQAIEEEADEINDSPKPGKNNDQKSNDNSQDEQKKDKTSDQNSEDMKDEDYRKQMSYKSIEYQSILAQKKYTKFVQFNSHITFEQTLLLRYFLNSTECIAQNLYLCEPTEEFLGVVKMWAKQEKLNELFDHFCMIPQFLESLIMIEAYGKIYKGQSWFSPELTNKMFKIKFQIEEFFNKDLVHKEREPYKYIKNIEQEINSTPSKTLPFDKAYDTQNFVFELISNSYSNSNSLFEAQEQKTAEISDGKVRMQKKRDLLTEQFVYNKENLLRKVLHSQIYSYFVNESHLKKYTGEVLFSLSSQVQKNVVFYPFYADFILPNKKIVIQVLEKNKMIDGVENILSGFNQQNEVFLKKIGYSIVYIDYSDFEIDFRSFQNNILKKIAKIAN